MSGLLTDGDAPCGRGTPLGKNEWLIILTLTALAAVLRLLNLGTPSLWFDELATWKVCNQPSLHALMTTGLADDVHVPGYFVITYGLIKTFGDSEFFLRLPAAVFSILSVPALYLLARRLCGRSVAIMSTLFVTLSFTCVSYGMEARPYSMMMFFGIVTTGLWQSVYETVIVDAKRVGAGQLLLLWIFLALTCATHYFSVMMVALQLGVFLTLALRAKRGAYIVVLMSAGLLLIAIPWIPELRLQSSQVFNWTTAVGFVEAFDRYTHFLFRFSPPYVGYAAAVLMLGALFPRGTRWLKAETQRQYRLGVFCFAAWIVPFVILETLSITVRPVFVDRYLSFCLPFAFMGISLQLSRLKTQESAKIALAAAIALLLLLHLEETLHILSNPKRDDWRRVEAGMGANVPRGAKVAVLAVTERTGVAQYYLGKYSPNLAIDGEAANIEQVPGAWDRVMAKKPDFIWFFYGQVAQPVTQEAGKAAQARLLTVSTGPISSIEDHMVGAFLFPVNKR